MERTDALRPDSPGAKQRKSSADRSLGRASDAALRTGNSLTLLRNGQETYEEWLDEIQRAERWIHMDYFIFKADRIGGRFAEALKEKAREGVAVRVSYDWLGNFRVPGAFWRDLERAGVETRVVNAPALGRTFGLLARDHRKILGVDGRYASVGGCASPTSGWATPRRRACPTATPPSA